MHSGFGSDILVSWNMHFIHFVLELFYLTKKPLCPPIIEPPSYATFLPCCCLVTATSDIWLHDYGAKIMQFTPMGGNACFNYFTTAWQQTELLWELYLLEPKITLQSNQKHSLDLKNFSTLWIFITCPFPSFYWHVNLEKDDFNCI